MVSTHLKNISQIGNLPQIGVKIENISNHHLVIWIYYIIQKYIQKPRKVLQKGACCFIKDLIARWKKKAETCRNDMTSLVN